MMARRHMHCAIFPAAPPGSANMNRRSLPVFVLFAAAILLPGVSFADDYKWIGQKTEDGASLLYAIPESDAVTIGFYCNTKTRRVTVSFEHEPTGAKDDVMVKINLALLGGDAKRSVTVQTARQRLELDDKFVLEGETTLSADLQRILTTEGTLVIAVEDGTQEIPLAGAKTEARHLLSACARKG